MVRAAVLVEFDKPIQIREFAKPRRIEAGAILVKMEMAGVCGTDVHLWHGRLKIRTPVILGHEGVGRIERLGEGVSMDSSGRRVEVGDRIMWTPGVACGRCYFCSVGKAVRCRNRKVYGITMPCTTNPYLYGDFSEYVYLIPAAHFFKVPRDVEVEELVSFGCAGPAMMHGYERLGGIQPGESVIIQGAGPVGLFALILARESGAKKIVVIGSPAKRLQMARRFGATDTIDLDEFKDAKERVEEALKLTDGLGADVVVEAAGVPSAFNEGIQLVMDGGRYLEIGQYTDRGVTPVNPHDITRKHITIYGSWGQLPRHLYRYIELISTTRNKYPYREMVTHTFPLEAASEALKTVEGWRAVKAAIKM